VFSAPPSGSDDYVAEVEAALKLWDGTGGFVFTGSTAVYAGTDGEMSDETTPQVKLGASPRTDRLLNAEVGWCRLTPGWTRLTTPGFST
jgi:hypothetical protein